MRAVRVILLFTVILVAGCTTPAATPHDVPPPPTTENQAPSANATDSTRVVEPSPERTAETTTPPPVEPSPTPPPRVEAPPSDHLGSLSVHYLNVGQGDGTIWEFPDGTIVIYDCGPPASSPDTNPVIKHLRGLGKPAGTTIRALIASHGHLDHIGGCEEILSEYSIEHLYEAWYDASDAPASYTRFRADLEAEGGTIHTMREASSVEGEQLIAQWEFLDLPEEARASAQLIWPPTFTTNDWDDIAEASLGIRLEFGTTSFCFQGDIETAQETILAGYRNDLTCDVYLVGHHGSRYASSNAWLGKMRPTHAVVSFGQNSYGHPTSEALCRIQEAGAHVYATHRVGTITIGSDGSTITTTATPETLDYCAPGASYWMSGPTIPTDASTTPEGELLVQATVSDAQPCRYSTVSIHVRVRDPNGEPVTGANATSTWHYKSTTSTEFGTTDAAGTVVLSRSIGGASADYPVRVDVTIQHGTASGDATTSFTPRAC